MVDETSEDDAQDGNELRSLFNVQRAITSQLEKEQVLQLIADEARRLTGSRRSVVFLLEGNEAQIAVTSGERHPFSVAGYRMPVAGSLIEESLINGGTIRIVDAPHDPHILADPRRKDLVDRIGLQSLLVVPLVVNDYPLGAISLSDKLEGEFGEQDEYILQLLASSAVVALENARLYGLEQNRRQVAQGLTEVMRTLNSGQPLTDILDQIVRQGVTLLSADACALYNQQSIQASVGLVEDLYEFEFWPVSSHPEVIASSSNEPYKVAVAVPIIVDDELYANLAFFYSKLGIPVEEKIELATILANQAALAIDNTMLRNQVSQIAVTEERGRLSRELHDSVTQSLYSLTLFAEAARQEIVDEHSDSAANHVQRIAEIGQRALKEMRLLIYELRPPDLEKLGLIRSLRQRLETVEGRAGIENRLVTDRLGRLSSHIEVALYRIVQEALNNVLKHAEASSVTVRLREADGNIIVEVLDDGIGFDSTANHGGLGLSSIRERVEQLHGTLMITSRPEKGTCLKVTIPENEPTDSYIDS